MHIGLTYDLRDDYLAEGYGEEETAEFDRPDDHRGASRPPCWRIGPPDRPDRQRPAAGRPARPGRPLGPGVQHRRGLHGLARESQVPAILDVYDIPYTFSDPLVLSLALHKDLTKTVVRNGGHCHARFRPGRAAGGRRRDRSAVPAVRQAGGRRDQQGDHGRLEDHRPPGAAGRSARELLRPFRQPVLVETFLPGREFTVGITGTGSRGRVLGTMEILLLPEAEAEVYSYMNKELCEDLVRYRLGRPDEDPVVREVERIALAAWRALGCRDGGRVDIRCDAAGRAQLHRGQPLAGPPSAAFRPADPLRLPGHPLRRSDRPDRPLGPAENRKSKIDSSRSS